MSVSCTQTRESKFVPILEIIRKYAITSRKWNETRQKLIVNKFMAIRVFSLRSKILRKTRTKYCSKIIGWHKHETHSYIYCRFFAYRSCLSSLYIIFSCDAQKTEEKWELKVFPAAIEATKRAPTPLYFILIAIIYRVI